MKQLLTGFLLILSLSVFADNENRIANLSYVGDISYSTIEALIEETLGVDKVELAEFRTSYDPFEMASVKIPYVMFFKVDNKHDVVCDFAYHDYGNSPFKLKLSDNFYISGCTSNSDVIVDLEKTYSWSEIDADIQIYKELK
jgi:hypothetical protein